MAVSQNGYKANDDSLVATYTIPGTSVKITLRKGDVSVVLLHFASWFNDNIQQLRQSDTGGYAKRTIEGSSTLSNHASGTAEDLRWNDHPLGKVGTFTASQRAKIEKQLKFYDGVIRWGGDYSGRKDEMHFEINKGLTEVSAVAKLCKATPAKTDTSSSKPESADVEPLVVDGKLGPETIKRWQKVMKTTQDGKISTPKSDLIKAVQARLRDTVDRRIMVDGQLGKLTIGGLQRYLKSPVDQHISTPRSLVVEALQRRLNTGKF